MVPFDVQNLSIKHPVGLMVNPLAFHQRGNGSIPDFGTSQDMVRFLATARDTV